MHKKRILIVEDEESLLKLETILLQVKGYEVTGCANGNDALEKLTQNMFDLVLLDIMLPDIDGFEICSRIRKEPRMAGIPVVMLTAKKSQADQARGTACGANAYLTKPFKSAMIIEVIEGLLKTSGAATRP
ncbi:MAG: two-component system response regulator [Desulfuromonadaceae bacterium GWB2_53_15]|nr:MAG: two-component system response regulator [Desulfuromonadales bacterium GWD2_54_10]OHB24545.1 MAG: two-component system response regulator [Desulfuromonadaceae bacterium GWB2_53_15]